MLGVELGYPRVSTAKQDLDRQIDALTSAGIPTERIYLDKKSGATTDRPRLRVLLDYARCGVVIVVHAPAVGAEEVLAMVVLVSTGSSEGLQIHSPVRC